jgi:hypothetical protein
MKANRICLALALSVSASAALAASPKNDSPKNQVFVGPPESGSFSGAEKWITAGRGAGFTCYDLNDPATGTCAFVVSNSVAGKENTADWRCPLFPLGPAAGGVRPLSFTFSYKLPEPVAPGNDILVQLRFFDSATNGVATRVYALGGHTSDSAMSSYRTLVMNGITPPRTARLADITIIANIDAPWTSGTGKFDDFALTTVPGPLIPAWAIGLAALLIIGGVTSALLVRSRRSVSEPKAVPAYR